MEQFIQTSTMIFGIVLVFNAVISLAELAVDFFWKHERNYKETFSNISINIVYEFISNSVIGTFGLAAWFVIAEFQIFSLPTTALTLIAGVVFADFIYYWMHRWEHEVNLLWLHHSVHHSSPDFNLSVAYRLGWTEQLFEWAFFIPMVLLGFHPILVTVSLGIVAIYQHWLHTKKIGKLGLMEHVLNTPSSHRVHHGRNDIYLDKNYGGIFIFWDKLFGTYQAETEPVEYGITVPLNTSNPLKINFSQYVEVLKQLKQTPSFSQKINLLLHPPGIYTYEKK